MSSYSHAQKQILSRLLLKYESSKTYEGKNAVSQSFSIKPSDVFKDYEKDSADVNDILDFEKQCSLLESEQLVHLYRRYERISKIEVISSAENWEKIRSILGVKDKNERRTEEVSLYMSYCESDYMDLNSERVSVIRDFCKEQVEKLNAGKKADFSMDDATNIISLLSFILSNKAEILERELSISVLSNSKTWELKYKSKVLKILRRSGIFDYLAESYADEKEINKVILEECNVFSNPSFVYFKGNGKISFTDKREITTFSDIPLALSSTSISKISAFNVSDSKIMTVENLTSFSRMKNTDTFLIFLSGYHNSAKQDFLKKIYNQNQCKEYFHFGDIDPDGFCILDNLCSKTQIHFQPYKMSISELIKYADFTKPLESNDISKSNSLILNGKFAEIMNYMLKHNIKLEQEIISWKEESN